MQQPAQIPLQTEELDYSGLEHYSNFLKFKLTWAFKKLICLPYDIIAAFTGNQAMKTSSFAYQYIYRILGWHPVAEKNVLYFECPKKHKYNIITLPKDWICPICNSELKIHERGSRTFRFASETLPGEKATVSIDGGGSAEVKNTVYPEFKKWLPPIFMKRDITFRNMAMIITDPNNGKILCDKEYYGNDILVEFVSYKQSVQGGAGVQRLSIWEDEEAPYEFHEEQIPRLMAESGDIMISLTPANKISWTYDEVFERAKVYVRTKAICDYLETPDYRPEQIEFTDSPYSVAVIQAATDDNPTMTIEQIEQKMAMYGDDPDIVATRRYGIHTQATGRIFKGFEYPVHFIEKDKYFPYDIPHDWVHARGIDYHPQTPWACGCISLSPQNEAFIWANFHPSPERYTTKEICYEFAVICKDYKFSLSLIDPLSEGIKKDKITILKDINDEFYELKKEGIGESTCWHTWDTKGEKGRDEIMKRLKNSKTCMRPFNNKVEERGRTTYLPTLWIFNNCKVAAEYMKKWRWEQYSEAKMAVIKDAKNKPEEKWSHFNTVWEAIFKHPSFKARSTRNPVQKQRGSKGRYFKGRR